MKVLLLWLVITGIVYTIKYVLDRPEKLEIRDIVIKFSYAGIYSTIIVMGLYLLNNIKGL